MNAMTPAPRIHSLLVPLDGSRLAEVTVPAATTIARRLGASITLLHVLEHAAPESVHGDRHLRTAAEAEAYLATIAAQVAATGVPVDTHVHANPEHDVARSLAEHANELDGGLVVLAAHGGGGLRGLLFGRIAIQVVRLGEKPVLLIQEFPADSSAPDFECRRIGALLNGTTEAEAALADVTELAQAFGATVHLIYAVPTGSTLSAERAASGAFVPSATRAILDLEERGAAEYLARIAASLAATGVAATSAVVRGDPAGELVAEAARMQVDLLALATHGRGGLGGIWSGSVGSKIASRFRKPLLLVPAAEV